MSSNSAKRSPRRRAGPDLAWHFFVVNTNEVNAFALPGGFIYVNRGLIEQSERLDQLAGTLGHEIGHVVRRHAVDQMKKQTGANIGVSLACTLTKICQHTGAQVVINAAGSALFAKYSRHDESEADSEAVVNVVNAGIDPRGIPELFQILLSEESARQRGSTPFSRRIRARSRESRPRGSRSRTTTRQHEGLTADDTRFIRSRPRWQASRRHRHRDRSTRRCHERLLDSLEDCALPEPAGVERRSTCVTPPEMMNAITSAASASMRSTRSAGTTRMCPAKPYDCGMYTVT